MRSSTAALRMPLSLRRCTSRSRVRADVMPMPSRRRSTIDTPQPARQLLESAGPRQIDLQRGHRDEAARDGAEIRARTGVLLRTRRSDPIDGTALWVLRAHHGFGAMAVAEPRRLQTLQLGVRPVGYIDVENHRRVQRRARSEEHT